MKRIGALILVLFMLLGTTTSAFAKKVGLQYWHTETLNWKINKDWKLSFAEEQRFDDDASHYFYQEGDITATYSGISDWFDVSLGFKHVLTESNNRWKREEWFPIISGLFKFNIGKFSLTDRNRLEYRIREAATDFWNYRNRLTVKAPWKFTSSQIRPYIADEFFVNETVSENRSYAGFTFNITKELSADIYYLQKRNRGGGGHWTASNVVGTILSYSF
ncbi:MAG: DUF2490 domain-containing protein [Candidatus Omnitrophota bacterium]